MRTTWAGADVRVVVEEAGGMLRALAQVHPTAGWRACKWARKWRSAMAAILPSGFVQPPGNEFDAFSCSCPGLSGCCSSPHRYRGALRAMQGVSVGGTESRCVNSASCCGRHDDTHEQPTRSIMCLQDIVKWVQETEGNRYLGLFRNSAASPKVTYCSKRSLHANFPVPAHIRSVRVCVRWFVHVPGHLVVLPRPAVLLPMQLSAQDRRAHKRETSSLFSRRDQEAVILEGRRLSQVMNKILRHYLGF